MAFVVSGFESSVHLSQPLVDEPWLPVASSERRENIFGFLSFDFTLDSKLFRLRGICFASPNLGLGDTVPDGDHDHEKAQNSQHTVIHSFLDLPDMIIPALSSPENAFDYVKTHLIRSMFSLSTVTS